MKGDEEERNGGEKKENVESKREKEGGRDVGRVDTSVQDRRRGHGRFN